MVTNIRQLVEEKLRNYPYFLRENNILYNTGRNYRVTRSCNMYMIGCLDVPNLVQSLTIEERFHKNLPMI
jgi:hypothetical protein